MKKGKLVTLSGVSGAGKSHLVKDLLASNLGFENVPSVTTRKPRDGENGNLHFLDIDEFKYLEKNGEFVLVGTIFGNQYTFFKKDFEKLDKGIHLITEYYYKLFEDFKQMFPEQIGTYILPYNPNLSIKAIDERNSPEEEKLKRKFILSEELNWIAKKENQNLFDIIHTNTYNEQSIMDFRTIIKNELERK